MTPTSASPREGEVARAPARDGGVGGEFCECFAAPSVSYADSSPSRGSTVNPSDELGASIVESGVLKRVPRRSLNKTGIVRGSNFPKI
mgnify:CR=1 FL=1